MERKHVLFIVLLVVAVVAVPGRMAWSMRSDAKAEADATRQETEDLEVRIVQARRDQARSGVLNTQLQALAAALPPDPDLASVIEQLAALSREANVTWKTSAQNQPVAAVREASSADEEDTTPTTVAAGSTDTTAAPTPAATSYLIDIDLEGTPANLTTFLEKVRSLPRLLTVERMTWAWQDGATGQPNSQIVSAHLTMKAYTWSGAPKALPGSTPTSGAP